MKKLLMFLAVLCGTGNLFAQGPMAGTGPMGGPGMMGSGSMGQMACSQGCAPAVSIFLYLAALALGYWMLRTVEKDTTQSASMKRLGKTIGWLILIVSFFGLVCKAGKTITCNRGMYSTKPSCIGPMVPPQGPVTPAQPLPPQN